MGYGNKETFFNYKLSSCIRCVFVWVSGWRWCNKFTGISLYVSRLKVDPLEAISTPNFTSYVINTLLQHFSLKRAVNVLETYSPSFFTFYFRCKILRCVAFVPCETFPLWCYLLIVIDIWFTVYIYIYIYSCKYWNI